MENSKIIQIASFNPKIKSYLLIYIAFILLCSVIGIHLLIIWFFGLGQYICTRYYENLKCQLTSNHLEYKKGVIMKVEKTIPLENIQDLTFIGNPILNYFNLRILKIETAGHSNTQGADMKLIGIVDPAEFKSKVLHQRELLKHEHNKGHVSNNNTDDQSVKILKEIRDLLNDIKNK